MLDQNHTSWRARSRPGRAGLMLVFVTAALGAPVPVASADELVVDDADAAVQITGYGPEPPVVGAIGLPPL